MIEPYGGKLVDRTASETEVKRFVEEQRDLIRIRPILDQIYDAEKIGLGAYSPLEGFMGSEDYNNVINKSRLSNGLPWTMPIILAPPQSGMLNEIKPSDEVAIEDMHGNPFATLQVEEKFRIDKQEFAVKVYGTTDDAHPNVSDLKHFGDIAVSGKVKLYKRLGLSVARHELTPKETREHFTKMGWNNVAAYQARNPPHLAHEYIQRVTLERDDVDGLFIQPIVGKLKKGDYKPEVIMKAYEVFVERYYPSDKVLLGSLSISMRYAGPKAVLFYAIVRRNYGCSHYIVGRDQAGVGNYYDPYAGHRIFDEFDVGVKPLRYQETFYCKACASMVSSKVCPHPNDQHISTSQTKIRQLLLEGKPLPAEILRPEVSQVLAEGDVILTESQY
ncbi:MAG: sulfate adenylyltransferase [Conexivisphaerales archaeon]